jgi:hypothetical protein
MSYLKTFPLNPGDRRLYEVPAFIPFDVIAPHEAQARANHDGRDLDEIARAGGLSLMEFYAVMHDKPFAFYFPFGKVTQKVTMPTVLDFWLAACAFGFNLVSKYYGGGGVFFEVVKREMCEVVFVERRYIPEGGRLVEAYETPREIVVCGEPPQALGGFDESDETAHNCDALGCSTISHVVYRFAKPAHLIAMDGALRSEDARAAD